MKKMLFIIYLFSFPSTILANCFNSVGKAYNIDPLLLESIALNESNNKNNIVSKLNTNGTYDIGIMQINSSHLNLLAKYNVTEDDLIHNTCINITVAGFILSSNIKTRGNTWDAVGAYNAGYNNSPETIERRRLYAKKIKNTYEMLKKRAEKDINNLNP